MHLITAVNKHYFPSVKNFIASVQFWSPEQQVSIYNLGMKRSQLKEIKSWQNVTLKWPDGIPVKHCVNGRLVKAKHLRRIKGYAWKVVTIFDALKTHESVLWIDGGCDIRASLNTISTYLKRDGYFFVKGQDNDMTKYLYEPVCNYLGVDKESLKDKPSYAGGIQGYVKDSRIYNQILVNMYNRVFEKKAICPWRATLKNHRFDQSLLSILIYQSKLELNSYSELISSYREHFSIDLELPSERIIYTARTGSTEYVERLKVSDNSL